MGHFTFQVLLMKKKLIFEGFAMIDEISCRMRRLRDNIMISSTKSRKFHRKKFKKKITLHRFLTPHRRAYKMNFEWLVLLPRFTTITQQIFMLSGRATLIILPPF